MNQAVERALIDYSNDIWGQAMKAGASEERERIIKLLEAGCERPLDPTWEHYRESCNCYQIELIKGEPEFTTTRQKQLYDLATRVENRIKGETK